MRRKLIASAMVAGAMLLALRIGPANAADKKTCTSTTIDVTKINLDGTTCTSQVRGSGPNKATAIASEKSRASADAEDGAVATADASNGGAAGANVVSGEGTAIAVEGGAEVDISNGGKATSKATGGIGSGALVRIEGTGGIANATAYGNAFAWSQIGSGPGGTAISIAKRSGTSFAFVDESESGTARAKSSDRATAQAVVVGNCKVTVTAGGHDDEDQSSAEGECKNAGSVVIVEATGGSFAQGSDTKPPICEIPLKGGTARVVSPGGNCSK
jgi:hypothetical protein